MRPLAVCSDPRATRKVNTNAFEDISVTDLALPATTDVAVLTERIKDAASDTSAMTVVFATYQSMSWLKRSRAAARSR